MRKIPFCDFFIVSGKGLKENKKELAKKDESLYIKTKIIGSFLSERTVNAQRICSF